MQVKGIKAEPKCNIQPGLGHPPMLLSLAGACLHKCVCCCVRGNGNLSRINPGGCESAIVPYSRHAFIINQLGGACAYIYVACNDAVQPGECQMQGEAVENKKDALARSSAMHTHEAHRSAGTMSGWMKRMSDKPSKLVDC